jgi:putative two-component system response regulator
MLNNIDVHSGKILVVDDNSINISVLEAILRKDGFSNIETCAIPTDVCERYRQNQHDIILLDVHMPGLSGMDIMGLLTNEYPNRYLPIIVLTADTSPDVRLKALHSGAKDFITKPFDKAEVRLRVRNILHVALLQNALRDHNIKLEEKVFERTKQLEDAQIKLIECLAKAGEFRDNETGQHVYRMSKMSALLAEAMGLDEHECELILHASPMHDIGKIGIPDSILLHPGKLDSGAWDIMKNHADIGCQIMADVGGELLNTAANIARTHHERWDGTGYPAGLKGKDIPLHGRIVAVCDVFDALLSERPYKKPWSVDAAVAYIADNSGSHFDPGVVEVFQIVLPTMLAIREQHPDCGLH